MAKIMAIAGTADARELIYELLKNNNEVVATVTTEYGKQLLDVTHGLEIITGKLDLADMTALIENKNIECIVDASHPFASMVSENAIKASGLTGVSYIRFERESISYEGDNLIKVRDFYEAADAASKIPGNIFLTIGANNLSIFTEKIPDFKKRLFARVLPDSRIIFKCEEAGLTAGNIIAVKGPFSKELNIEMLKHVKASVIVTKESGEAGGTLEKLSAASYLGIPVILVERPKVEYGARASVIHDVLKLVEDMRRR